MNSSLFAVLLLCAVVCATYASYLDNTNDAGRSKRSRGPSSREPSRARKTWRLTAISNRLFAHKLYRNIARVHRTGNLLISPFVVSTALSMVLLGARGVTENELMRTLEYSDMGTKQTGRPYTKADVPRLYRNLLQKTNGAAVSGRNAFLVASKLFGEQTENFLPQFISDTERYYGAKFEALDFARDPEGAREHINDWVSNKTRGIIEEAVPPGSIASDTLLTMVSTAYFKGTWEHQFEPELTSPGVFQLSSGTEILADFMEGDFMLSHKYSTRFSGEIVVLPYKRLGTEFQVRMELFLPDDPSRLLEFETADEDTMNFELRGLKPLELKLYLPKFRIDYDIDLRENLETLGLESLFSDADLSGMNGKHNLNIGNAIHKSFIQVNEEGTTAGAAISLISIKSSQKPVVRFDHPFFFIIRETYTNSVLFMGRVDNPNQ